VVLPYISSERLCTIDSSLFQLEPNTTEDEVIETWSDGRTRLNQVSAPVVAQAEGVQQNNGQTRGSTASDQSPVDRQGARFLVW